MDIYTQEKVKREIRVSANQWKIPHWYYRHWLIGRWGRSGRKLLLQSFSYLSQNNFIWI